MVRGISAHDSHLGTLWSSHHSIIADHHIGKKGKKKEKKRVLEDLACTIKCSSAEVTNPVTERLES